MFLLLMLVNVRIFDMNYQPFIGMHVLLSNEFIAFFHFCGFVALGVLLLLLLIAYQKQRATDVRSGSC